MRKGKYGDLKRWQDCLEAVAAKADPSIRDSYLFSIAPLQVVPKILTKLWEKEDCLSSTTRTKVLVCEESRFRSKSIEKVPFTTQYF